MGPRPRRCKWWPRRLMPVRRGARTTLPCAWQQHSLHRRPPPPLRGCSSFTPLPRPSPARRPAAAQQWCLVSILENCTSGQAAAAVSLGARSMPAAVAVALLVPPPPQSTKKLYQQAQLRQLSRRVRVLLSTERLRVLALRQAMAASARSLLLSRPHGRGVPAPAAMMMMTTDSSPSRWTRGVALLLWRRRRAAAPPGGVRSRMPVYSRLLIG